MINSFDLNHKNSFTVKRKPFEKDTTYDKLCKTLRYLIIKLLFRKVSL